MKFGSNLTKFRKIKGLTQEELAEKMQVSRQSVSKWETGESIPDVTKIVKIADILQISMDELCGRDFSNEQIPQQLQKQPPSSKSFKINPFIILMLMLLCVFCGYLVGQYERTATDNILSKTTALPTNINVTGISFVLEKSVVICEFVPEFYSEDFIYTVTMKTNSGITKSGTATFENGIATVQIPISTSEFYKVVLEVSNGTDSLCVALAEKIYVDIIKNKQITVFD